ncbi:MAG TPA: IS4 family transposase [Polyangia bacterium]|jgi:Transposase Tn5 dimerisation domain.|nr:IS4 family transposase [Polyangia bacterium]
MKAFQATAWAVLEFGRADLGHAARTKRAVRVGAALVQNPSSSIPRFVENAHQAKGVYRLLSNPQVKHNDILSGHIDRTTERCLGRSAVLVIQDTTTLSYTEHPSVRGLGPVNDSAEARGFLAHTAIAVSVENHDVLGVLDQHAWVRGERKVTEGESGKARKKRRRESEHWAAGQHRVGKLFRNMEKRPRIIAVFDREGDIFEAFEALDELGHSFIIRAARNRLVESEGEDKQYSLDCVGQAPVVARREVDVPARAGRAARVAQLEIRAKSLTICPPRNRGRHGDSIRLNIVAAIESQPPEGVEPLVWYLVTREPIETAADVLAVVRGYEARWIIEELHMGMKTGCSTEQRQLETVHALRNFLAFATVVAWQMLCLRDAARRPEPVRADQVLTPLLMTVLCGLRPRLKADCLAGEALRAIAVMGGFMGRKGDGNPGWRTLWAGFEKLLMAEKGFLVARERFG